LENGYQIGLLYLSHILISADGIIHEEEQKALLKIKDEEKISQSIFDAFQRDVKTKKLNEIYQRGIDLVLDCTPAQKKKIFTYLFKLAMADGNIHVKEVRLLLYSAKMTEAELAEALAEADKS